MQAALQEIRQEVRQEVRAEGNRLATMIEALGAQLGTVAGVAIEARDSSHDLADRAKAAEALAEQALSGRMPSERVKAIALEAADTIVSKKRLAELEGLEASRTSDTTSRRTLIVASVVSGVVLMILTWIAAHIVK
jgi:hypothetical protein